LIVPRQEKVCEINTPTTFSSILFSEDLGLALKFTRESNKDPVRPRKKYA
jgi:hypothetical protein